MAHKWWDSQSRNIIIQSPGVAQSETAGQWGHQTSWWPGPPFVNRPGLTAWPDNHQPPRPISSPYDLSPSLIIWPLLCSLCCQRKTKTTETNKNTTSLEFGESRHPRIPPWSSQPRLALCSCSDGHWWAMVKMAISIPQLSTETYSL